MAKIFDATPERLSFLLSSIHNRAVALPDFQRDFVWDARATEELIESICRSFPAGSLLRIKNGAGFAFAPRAFAGAPELDGYSPAYLILDGQQRLTSLYRAFYGAGTHRYFLDFQGLLDGKDLEDSVFYLRPKVAKRRYGTVEKQAEALVFPMADLFGSPEGFEGWLDRVLEARAEEGDAGKALKQRLREEQRRWLKPVEDYEFPMVTLADQTSAEAVCTIFETLNRTGVKLSVFDLLAARFWADDLRLRDLWDDARTRVPLIEEFEIDPYYVLQVVAILSAPAAPACKRSDVLALDPERMRSGWGPAIRGLGEALAFLRDECRIVVPQWVPYLPMLIPLAVLFAELDVRGPEAAAVRGKLRRWFWCSIFGQTYENPPNSQAVKDIGEFRRWRSGEAPPDAVREFSFDASVLRQTTPNQRALYRSVICLLLEGRARDFHKDKPIDASLVREQQIEDHHVFPKAWLRDHRPDVPEALRDCVLNRTLIDRSTNQSIGRDAPSVYLQKIEAATGTAQLRDILRSHLLPKAGSEIYRKDDFDAFLGERQTAIEDEDPEAHLMSASAVGDGPRYAAVRTACWWETPGSFRTAQTATSISRTMAPSPRSPAAARYSRMASRMFSTASCSVTPWDQQPGRPGTETLNPSSEGRSAILNFMGPPETEVEDSARARHWERGSGLA